MIVFIVPVFMGSFVLMPLAMSVSPAVATVALPTAQAYPNLAVECPAGLLQAEVVVEFCIGQVPAFHREIVAALFQAVSDTQIVCELFGHVHLRVLRANTFGVERKIVLIIIVVGDA